MSEQTISDKPAERDSKSGRFGAGNKFGKGSPVNLQAANLRAALMRTATPDDVEGITRALIDKAKGGNVAAGLGLLGCILGAMKTKATAAESHAMASVLHAFASAVAKDAAEPVAQLEVKP